MRRQVANQVHRLLVLAALAGAGGFAAGCLTTVETDDPPGPPGPAGPAGPSGPAGPTGAAGASGLNCWDVNGNGIFDLATEDANGDGVASADDCAATAVFGDGSAGPLTIDGDTDWSAQPLANLNFTELSIDADATLTVPSGTVIRCTGAFTNNGTIIVLAHAGGGRTFGLDAATLFPAYQAPSAGIARSAAASGEFGDATQQRQGGAGGEGILALQARLLFEPGLNGGGGGGAAGIDDPGSRGGGSLIVRARGALLNAGAIRADGETGSSNSSSAGGGGGGGVLILASGASVTINATATLAARGGAGENADSNEAASAGGGGGIVHLIAPTITAPADTILVTGGAGGTGGPAATVSAALRTGGGGGGACGGNGGTGATAELDGSTADGGAGGSGLFLVTNMDPSFLF